MGAARHKQAGAEFLFTEAKGANAAMNPLTARTGDNLVPERKQQEDEEVPQEQGGALRVSGTHTLCSADTRLRVTNAHAVHMFRRDM